MICFWHAACFKRLILTATTTYAARLPVKKFGNTCCFVCVYCVSQLDFVEFSVALGTMIKGEDDEKLALAFRILRSPRKIQGKAHSLRVVSRRQGASEELGCVV